MKIGIITICKVNNYGAELQAFATCKKLELLGYDAEIIDYTYYKDWRFKDSRKSEPLIPMSGKDRLMYWVKYRLINCLVDTVLPIFSAAVRKRKANYAAFIGKGRFSRPYRTMDDLYRHCGPYDVYMVGSDQVWNPGAASSIEPYFLTFAPEGAKKVSYAASFGVADIAEPLQKKYRQWLGNIHSIAVREQSGANLVKRLIGKEAKWVLDPTLLLDKAQWIPFMNKVEGISGKYVLVYELLPSIKLINVARRLAESLRLPVYCLCKRGYAVKKHKGMVNILEAGPSEFLWLIANATCMVTNSFHGTAFSVNFSTPFCCVLNRERKNNARMLSLLGNVGLMERVVYEDEVDDREVSKWLKPVDNTGLEALVNESEEYLRNECKPYNTEVDVLNNMNRGGVM